MPSSTSLCGRHRRRSVPARAALAALAVLGALVTPAAAEMSGAATVAADSFTPINPARVTDTRGRLIGGRFGPAETRVLGLAAAWMPPGAVAASLNVTVVAASEASYLSVWRAGAPQPPTSSLNFRAGEVRAAAVVAEVDDAGQVSIFNAAGTVDVVVDVTGWLGDGFHPVPPARLADTRGGSPVNAGETRTVAVAGNGGVPATGATAAAVTVTVTNPDAAGYVTVWPEGSPQPGTSTVNFDVGETLAATVLVGLGPSGGVSLAAAGARTDVIVDLIGWFSAGYTPLPVPSRLLDTRDGTGRCGLWLGPGEVRTISVAGAGGAPGTGVGAAALNLTVTGTSEPGVLTVWPAGQPQPLASNLNYRTGQTVANGVLVGLGAAGQVSIANQGGSAEVIVDLSGTFPGTTPGGEPTACPPFTTTATVPVPGRRLPDGTVSTLMFNASLAELGVTPTTSSPVHLAMALTDTLRASDPLVNARATSYEPVRGIVVIIDDRRFDDDSVAGRHYEVTLQRLDDGSFRVVEARWGYDCRRRPTPPYAPAPCP